MYSIHSVYCILRSSYYKCIVYSVYHSSVLLVRHVGRAEIQFCVTQLCYKYDVCHVDLASGRVQSVYNVQCIYISRKNDWPL